MINTDLQDANCLITFKEGFLNLDIDNLKNKYSTWKHYSNSIAGYKLSTKSKVLSNPVYSNMILKDLKNMVGLEYAFLHRYYLASTLNDEKFQIYALQIRQFMNIFLIV